MTPSIEPEQWVAWDGLAATIPSGLGWVQFEHETREQAEQRGLTQIDFWPWYGEDRLPIVLAYKLAQAQQ